MINPIVDALRSKHERRDALTRLVAGIPEPEPEPAPERPRDERGRFAREAPDWRTYRAATPERRSSCDGGARPPVPVRISHEQTLLAILERDRGINRRWLS